MPASPPRNTNFLQFRVIDDAAEYVDQYNGDLWGMYLAVEQPDGQFLDQHGLPDGNLYKMEGGTGELNNQGPTHPTNKSDLNAFQAGYSNASQTDQWFRDNMNLESYYNYRAIVEAIHHYDIDESAGKNYFFYHNPVTDKWETTVWDLDLTWSNNMYGGGDEPFRDRVLPRAAFSVEYKNRVRELRDLLFNPDQTGALIDEMAAKIYTAGQASWVDIDRAVWDWNPVMADPNRTHSDRGGQGRFYTGYGGQVIPAPGGFAGMMQKMKNYASAQSGQRGAHLDTLAQDAAIPNKPVATYQGPAGFPADRLRFSASAFADPQGAGTFAAMKWRIAEVTNPAAPGYDPKAPKKYEINAVWESGELTTFASDVDIPAQYVREGRTYRVRVRMKDATGRWSRWSDAAQFVAGQPDQTVRDALRITEVNYHPAANPSGPPAEDEFEFVELLNTSATAINLRDVRFAEGIEYTFGDVALLPGQYIVVARNRDAFAQRYADTGVLAPGVFTRSLDNASDHLILVDATNQVIHDFTYFDTWHPTTDGDGPTLVVADISQPLTAWDTAAGWRPSSVINGSPGGPDGAVVDITPPAVDVTDVTPDPRNAPVASARFVFSEPVTGFDLADVVLTRDGGANLLTGAQTLTSTDGGRTWTLGNLAGLTAASGAYSLRVNAAGSGIEDAAGNAMVNGAADNWTTDATAPTVDITDVAPDPRTTAVASITITFSEPVTGFDKTDLTLTRDGGANLIGASHTLTSGDGGRTWVLGGLTTQTGAAGTYTLTLAAGGTGIIDFGGNAPASGATEQWAVDLAAPTAAITPVTPDPRSTPVDSITITFNEPVTGFDLSDLALVARNGGGTNLLTPAQTLTSSDGGRTWTLDNLAGITGALGAGYALQLTGSGSGIRDAVGNLMVAVAFEDWLVAAVFGRHVFYNNSSFDGFNGTATAADDGAVATDKAALLPGAAAMFANYTSYSRGINGVMVDVAGLPTGGVRGVDASDFIFRAGKTGNPSAWADTPAPQSVTVRRGAGAGGSDRVTIVWADGAIRNQWLQVTVKANGVTGLAVPDVFYFGNQAGETGDSATDAAVTAADYADTRAMLMASSAIGGRYDFNRDGRVNTSDVLIVRGAMLGSIPLLGAPAAVTSFGQTPIAATGVVTTGAARATLATRRAWYEQPADLLS